MSTLDHLDEPSFDTQASSGNNGHQLVNSDDEFNSDLDDFPMELDDSNLHSNSNAGHLNRIPGVGSSFNKVKNSFSNAFFFRQPRNSFSNFNLQPSTDNFDDEDYEQYNVNHGYNIGKKIEYEDLSAIDWQMEYAKERERKKKLELQPGFYGKFLWLLDISHIWIVLILTGISVAFVAAFIDVVSRWLGDVKFGHCTDAFYLPREYCCSGIDLKDECPKWVSWETSFHLRHDGVFGYILSYLFYLVFTVMFAVAASILVLFYAPHARFSGMPEIKTILSGFVMKGFLGFKTLIMKSIGLILVVASGLWVGKEGPLVHVACCCANVAMMLFPQYYRNEAIKREVLTAAASAGISVAFGSPIGGVLFSLEQLSYYFPERILWNSFVAAMVAGVSLSFINPLRTGNLVLFQVVYDRVWHRFELVPFAIIGVLGGLYGAFFIRLNIYFAKWRQNNQFLSRRPVLEVAIVALITGIVTFPNIYTKIPTALSLSHLFQECTESAPGNLCKNESWVSTFFLLVLSTIQGFFLTAYTFGTNIPAGLIMPSMVNGAFMGRAIGTLIQTWRLRNPGFILFESCPVDGVCITPGVYALVGAASTLCGVTHLTVSTVVIMFELTGALNYVIPIMTGVMVSKWVSDAFNRKGIYETWIQFKEYPYLDNHNDQPIPDVAVESIMTKVEDLTLIPANGSTVGSLHDTLETSSSRGFPIVKSQDDMTLVGYITSNELRRALIEHTNTPRDTPCTFTALEPTTPTLGHGASDSYSADDASSIGGRQDSDGVSLFEFDGGHNHAAIGASSAAPVNLREWAELDPMTLSWESSLQLAASMFAKLGLRFILFTDKGQLCGLLTRKDVWLLLNSLDDLSNSMNEHFEENSASTSSLTARGRLLSTLSYSLRGSEDEVRLLAGQDDDYDETHQSQESA